MSLFKISCGFFNIWCSSNSFSFKKISTYFCFLMRVKHVVMLQLKWAAHLWPQNISQEYLCMWRGQGWRERKRERERCRKWGGEGGLTETSFSIKPKKEFLSDFRLLLKSCKQTRDLRPASNREYTANMIFFNLFCIFYSKDCCVLLVI